MKIEEYFNEGTPFKSMKAELTLIQMREQKILFFDNKHRNTYFIKNMVSEHEVNHIRVIYLVSTDGRHSQSFSDYYFFQLLSSGSIKQL